GVMTAVDDRLITMRFVRNWLGKVERDELTIDNAWDLLLDRIAAFRACDVCGQKPCPDPAFCESCRTADQKIAASRKCAQCGAGGGTLDPHRHLDKRKIVYLHPACKRFWEQHHR